MNLTKLIKEEMSDILTHYTDSKGLLEILKDGKLRGREYNYNKNNLTNKYDFVKELCLVRKTNKDFKNLSEATANSVAKFHFDFDNIKNIRGVKKPYPIAELPIGFLEEIESLFYVIAENKKNKLDYKDVPKILKEIKSGKIKTVGQLNNYIMNIDPEIITYADYRCISEKFKLYRNSLQKREMEERVDLTKAEIPLSPKYIKIELTKPVDHFLYGGPLKKMIQLEYFRNKDLFVNNKYLEKVINEPIKEEEELTKKRRNDFTDTVRKNYEKVFVKNIEKIINKQFCNSNIKRIELEPELNTIKKIKIYGKDGKLMKDELLENKINRFYKLKKRAFELNSDYYFNERPPANQKEALMRRSIGEEFDKLVNLTEAIVKTDRVKPDLEFRKKMVSEVMPKIKNGEFAINLRPERVEDIEYIARLAGNEEIIRKSYFAAGLEYDGEKPGFNERMKAQNELKNGKYKKIINDTCKTKLIEILVNSKIYPFVDLVGNLKQIVFKQHGSATFPYTKFNYKDGKLTLISCHDSKFSFKKKSYSDTNSWKFGNKKTLEKVRKDMDKIKE